MHKQSLGICLISMLSLTSLAQQFGPQQLISKKSLLYPTATYAADLDGDSLNDVIGVNDSVLVWWKNLGGGVFADFDTITTGLGNCDAIYSDDLDDDGDFDIIVNSTIYHNSVMGFGVPPPPTYSQGFVYWVENYGTGNFGPIELVTTDTIGYSGAFSALDINGDGDKEILVGVSSFLNYNHAAGQVLWHENLGGSFGPEQTLSDSLMHVRTVKVGDIDDDGDDDLICGRAENGKLAWFENQGNGFFGTKQLIGDAMPVSTNAWFTDLEVMDWSGDSLVDIVAVYSNENANPNLPDSSCRLLLYKNLSGSFGIADTIFLPQLGGAKVSGNDLDNDGDNDIVLTYAYNNVLIWLENLGGGVFDQNPHLLDGNCCASNYTLFGVLTTELTGDNLVDILTFSGWDIYISYFQNQGSGQFAPERVITPELNGPTSVVSADIDGDGDMDVLASSSVDGRIALFENMGGAQFTPAISLTTDAYGANRVITADLDNDGDLDVISAAYWKGEVAWYENVGGNVFGPLQVIADSLDRVENVYSSDIDNDGDFDVISIINAGYSQNLVAIYLSENLGGGLFAPKSVITTNVDNANIAIGDLTGDSLPDLVVSMHNERLSWFKNLGGGVFDTAIVLQPNYCGTCLYPTLYDVDDDGDLDILFNYFNWFQNLGGGNFSSMVYLVSPTYSVMPLVIADIDNDTDDDFFIMKTDLDSYTSQLVGYLSWLSNTGGSYYQEDTITSELDWPRGIFSADLDNDGDMDILTASYGDNKIAWNENNSLLVNAPANNEPRGFKIYPNPFAESTTIVFGEDYTNGSTLIICDLAGRLVKSRALNGESQVCIHSSDTGKGFFIAYLEKDKKRTLLGKLVAR